MEKASRTKMDSKGVVQILQIFFFFCICVYFTNCSDIHVDQSEVHQDAYTNKSVNLTGISAEHFAEAVELIRKSNLYNKLQEVLVHYVQHFLVYNKMTMLTKSGRITVPISEKIERNLSTMVRHILHVESTYSKIKNKTFDFTDPVSRFRFIRNNTVLLDKIFEHANASFIAHKDIENPEKIKFYHSLKNETRFFKIKDLHQSMNVLIEIEKAASPSFSNLVNGKLYDGRSGDLNSEECLDIGKHASLKEINQSIQFYEAAVRRLDSYEHVVLNKTKILQEVIVFYSKYGQVCMDKVSKLQDKLEKSLTEINMEDDDDDNAEEDDVKDNGTENDSVKENDNTKTQKEVEKPSETFGKQSKAKDLQDSEESKKEPIVNDNESAINVEMKDETSNSKNDSKNIKGQDKSLNGTAENNEGIKDNIPDEDDGRCIMEIINSFSKQLSSTHDEL